ncbi:MAG TPA: hypothetical protein PKA41_19080 [Verrucomicrobiota bacterium]|nr:hypothetical protein [Verrucomicrobiota bacterium]
MNNPLQHLLAAVALCGLVCGCATDSSTKSFAQAAAPRDDVAEFRKIVAGSLRTTKDALESLDAVGVQASGDPADAVRIFAGEVQELEVESVRMRSRALAMERSGEAYFAQWHKKLAAHPEASTRDAAARNRDQLQKSFDALHATSLQLRTAFKPFLSNLRQARNTLEAQPDLSGVDAAKQWIVASHKTGREVQSLLATMLAELNTISALLKSVPNP